MSTSHPSLVPGRPVVVLLWLVLLAGCGDRPSAPPLHNDPVHHDYREGFRFSPPEGWVQRARGVVPAGKVSGERMLVEYKCLTCTETATLSVSVADVPPDASLSDFVSETTLTGENWKLVAPVESFEINGAPAARILYTMQSGKDELVRDVVAFRRGERAYFFKGFYSKSDGRARKAVHAALDTLVW